MKDAISSPEEKTHDSLMKGGSTSLFSSISLAMFWMKFNAFFAAKAKFEQLNNNYKKQHIGEFNVKIVTCTSELSVTFTCLANKYRLNANSEIELW